MKTGSSDGKHTPGPWKVCRTTGRSTNAEGFCLVASYRIDDEEREVNARIIEQGPEMLEAIEEMAHTFHVSLGFEQQTRELNKLIAKIKGQS